MKPLTCAAVSRRLHAFYDGELPVAFNGIISQPGDVDFFRFKAKKDQALDIRVIARHLRSPLDSVLTLYNADGGGTASNDDSGSPDSYIRFTQPANAEYVISIADQLSDTVHRRIRDIIVDSQIQSGVFHDVHSA